jgi:hypothetical protein
LILVSFYALVGADIAGKFVERPGGENCPTLMTSGKKEQST